MIESGFQHRGTHRWVHTSKRSGRRGRAVTVGFGGSFLGKGCAGVARRMIQVRVLAPHHLPLPRINMSKVHEIQQKDFCLPSWWTWGATLLVAILAPIIVVLLVAALGAIFA